MIQLPLCADRCSAPPEAPDRPFLCVNVLLFFVFDSAVTKSKEKYVFLLFFLFLFFLLLSILSERAREREIELLLKIV